MNYHRALFELLSKNTNPKLGLSRMRNLLSRLELSLFDTRIIQVVGTNGKGSTVAFIESILKAQSYTTGLFTSPHLCTARERIRINGLRISEELFVQAAAKISLLCESLEDQPSFFERILAMAMWLFAQSKLDVIILEAGLGGRLDATTACDAHILGVATIAFDHQHILGETLELISAEKIAAARPGQYVVSVKQDIKAQEEIIKAQKKIGFNLSWASPCEEPSGLYGDHQKLNAGLALALIKKLGLKTSKDSESRGLLEVKWPGRFEIIKKHEVKIILDGAHNPSGIKALAQALANHSEFNTSALVLVFGSLVGQSREKISELLNMRSFAHIFIHCPQNPRAESALALKNIFIDLGMPESTLSIFKSFEEVAQYAKRLHSYVLVCGSLYTIGEARASLLNIVSDPAVPNF